MAVAIPSWVHPFISLSYPVPAPEAPDSFPDSLYYGTGLLDGCLLVTLIAIMAVLRDSVRLGVLEPFARRKLSNNFVNAAKRASKNSKVQNGKANGNGHTNGNGNATFAPSRKQRAQMHRSVLRFAEQGWPFICYSILWSSGLYIHTKLPTRLLNPEDVWVGYPHVPIPGTLKLYYLTQTACYFHQILILNAEERRKDHVQMMTHHVVTISLLIISYLSNFTRVGCLIMLLMDFCDIFLPMAKMLKYLSYINISDPVFGFFMVSWVVTRHVLFMIVIYSTYFDLPRISPPVWAPERGLYLSERRWLLFVTLLSALQVLQMIWFGMICRVAWKVVTGGNAEDERSDDESDYESDEENEKKQR